MIVRCVVMPRMESELFEFLQWRDVRGENIVQDDS